LTISLGVYFADKIKLNLIDACLIEFNSMRRIER